jgi:hypothetical protein
MLQGRLSSSRLAVQQDVNLVSPGQTLTAPVGSSTSLWRWAEDTHAPPRSQRSGHTQRCKRIQRANKVEGSKHRARRLRPSIAHARSRHHDGFPAYSSSSCKLAPAWQNCPRNLRADSALLCDSLQQWSRRSGSGLAGSLHRPGSFLIPRASRREWRCDASPLAQGARPNLACCASDLNPWPCP